MMAAAMVVAIAAASYNILYLEPQTTPHSHVSVVALFVCPLTTLAVVFDGV